MKSVKWSDLHDWISLGSLLVLLAMTFLHYLETLGQPVGIDRELDLELYDKKFKATVKYKWSNTNFI